MSLAAPNLATPPTQTAVPGGTASKALDLDPNVLRASYKESDRSFRVQEAKVGCILVLACMPLGAALDWIVYPQALGPFVVSRILCDLAVLPIFWALFRDWGTRRIGPDLSREGTARSADWLGQNPAFPRPATAAAPKACQGSSISG